MTSLSSLALTITLLLPLGGSALASDCCPAPGVALAQSLPAATAAPAAPPVEMAASGKENPLPGGGWFTWEFDRKPAMGTAVFKIRVFDKTGAQVSTLKALGEVDMPSMRGHHSSGPVEFKLNKKKDYLLPVNIVMRGEWEVAVTISQGDRVVYRGYTRFRV